MTVITIFIFISPIDPGYFPLDLPVDVRVQVSKYDVSYGISLALPEDPNENFTLCLQYAPPLTYLIL